MYIEEIETDWNGPKVESDAELVAIRSVNQGMAKCVIHAKQNHPNWNNRTGAAEGSVRIIQPAMRVSRNEVVGIWGSKGINYAVYLEENFPPWLRDAQDKIMQEMPAILQQNAEYVGTG